MLVFIAHFIQRNKRFFVVGPGRGEGEAAKKLFFLSLPPPSTMYTSSHSVFLKMGDPFLGPLFCFLSSASMLREKSLLHGLRRKQLEKEGNVRETVACCRIKRLLLQSTSGQTFFLSLLACTHAITRISEFMHVIFIERRRGEVKAFCRIKVARKRGKNNRNDFETKCALICYA